jgi:hypothetical protein
MKNRIPIALSFVLVGLFSTKVDADLMVDIAGIPGSGITNWVFSGTEVAGADEDFDTGFLNDFASVWVNHGDLFKTSWRADPNIIPPSGATITTSYGTRNINLLFMREQGSGSTEGDPGQDDFGVGVDGSTNLRFDAGETISWTGSFVLDEDIQDMNEGTYSWNYFANIYETLDLTVTISYSSVPEPSSIAVLLLTVAGLTTRRRRRPRHLTL